MAIGSPSRIPAQTQERIASPLHQLRGAIRRYIVLEAVAVFLILLSLWYWIGLGLDYGTFKLTGFDYVQLIPHWFRWVVLLAIVAVVGLMVTLNLVRLARTFRDESLALVLERRFPKLLGDRLITAIELADLDDAETHGYSRAMILKTVDDVSRDVDRISIRDVFNWGRIKWQYGFLVILTAVLFFGSMAGDFVAHRSVNLVHFAHRQWDRSSIWFERNILIWDTLWPRRAYLELVDFPASGELRIGRDAPSPRIRARALKWVTVDRSAADGWRALTWADLTPKLLGGRAVPALPAALLVPPSMANAAPPATDPYWTLDRVEMLLDTAEVRERLLNSGMPEPDYTALRDSFDALNATADNPAMSRTMRRLIIPRDVTLYYWGQKIDNNMPLTRQQDANEYVAVVTDLKESVKFYVKGEDFATSNRSITLVPPPMLTRLERDEEVPAYHYHRPPAGKGDDLKGLKQKRTGLGTSLTGSTSRIDIESGSHMTLRGEVDKDLTEVRIRYRTQKADDKPAPAEVVGPAAAGGEVETLTVNPDRRSFSKRFESITRPIEFDFEFTDTDNVKSLRHVVIQPKEDRPPDVDVAVEIIRKTPQGYMCTAVAMIPFSGRVRDAEGLSKVDYTVSYMKVESAQAAGIRAAVAAGVLGGISPSPTPVEIFAAPALVDMIARMSESREAVVPVPPLPLATFADMTNDRNREYGKGKDEILKALSESAPSDADRRMIRAFEIKPNTEFLDLQERIAELKKAGESALIAPRFRMRVTVLATDNNVETGPRVGMNKETFTFLVVPYEELLGEIAKDDQALGDKLADAVAKLEDMRLGIDKVVERMPKDAGSEEFRPAASRMADLIEIVTKNHDVVQEVLNECNRVLKEMQTNRLPQARIDSKQTVCNRLDEALRTLFPAAEDAHAAFLRQLEERRPPDPNVVTNSRLRQKELVEHLAYTRELLGSVSSQDAAAAKLKLILDGIQDVKRVIKALEDEAKDGIFFELSTLDLNASAVEMQKGERRVVAVDLIRTDYFGRYVIHLKATDNSNLTIPATIQVPRESKQLQFEIIAGNTTGDFVIQLVPRSPAGAAARGKDGREYDKKPFEIKVKVK